MFESLPKLPLARRWRGQKHPMPSVVALIRRDSVTHYLLIKRQAEPYSGKWALVGGKWDFGETLATAITREVKEETGLDTKFVALRGLVSERIAPPGAGDHRLSDHAHGGHFLLFVCELSAPTGQAREQSEGPVAWFSLEDLKELRAARQIISTDYTILERFGQTEAALAYFEADVVAGDDENAPDELVRFEPGP